MKEDIVISGCGIVSSLGSTADETWNALLEGKSGLTQIEEFKPDEFPVKRAARAVLPSPEELGIHPRDARIMGAHSFILMKCVLDAASDSRVSESAITPEETGFFAGMGMVDSDPDMLIRGISNSLDPDGQINYGSFFSGAYEEIYPLWLLSTLNNISFCQASIRSDIKGDNTVFSSGRDAGMHALIEACHSVAARKSRLALAGGVSEEFSVFSEARRINSTVSKCPSKRDPSGEGGAISVLELRADAERRGITPVARFAGYGASFGIARDGVRPSEEAMVSCMKKALSSAGIKTSSVAVVIASSGTTLSESGNEFDALKKIFGQRSQPPQLYSSAPALGDMRAGSSAVNTVLAERIIRYGIIPPVPGIEGYGNRTPFGQGSDAVMINAFSNEGSCASIIIQRTG